MARKKIETRDLGRAAVTFAVTAAGLLAGAVGLAAYAARRAAGAGEGPRPEPLAPADPMIDPRPAPSTDRADRPAPALAASADTPGGHAAPDLSADAAPVTTASRAPQAFRPDPEAVPTAEEREALRPATGPATGFAATRGSLAAGPARADS